jgi:site-specific DNA-cytosine methylase
MKILELFAGSRSIGKVCDELGHKVFSSDWEQFDGIDYAVDINKFDPVEVPFIPDVIWASPPCTTFSVASIGKHWDMNRRPKTEDALMGMQILTKTIKLIKHFQTLNPDLIWYIENPRGMMRKVNVWDSIQHIRQTVTYCQYGDTRMKPTDIWTNNFAWKPRMACKNGDPCHVSAPRGSRTGTQGLKGSYVRSQIPFELCLEVIKSAYDS